METVPAHRSANGAVFRLISAALSQSGCLGDRYLSLSDGPRPHNARKRSASAASGLMLPSRARYVKLLTETLTDWSQLRHFALTLARGSASEANSIELVLNPRKSTGFR